MQPSETVCEVPCVSVLTMTTTIAGCASRINVSSAPATTRGSSGQSKHNPIVQFGEGYFWDGGIVVAQFEVIFAPDDRVSVLG